MIPTATAPPTGRPGYTQTLPRTARSAEDARRLVRAALSSWGLNDLADAGALLVSELVTNAVRHTRSRLIRVTVTRTARNTVRVAVVDMSRTPPVGQQPDVDAMGGRGLAIVAALTARWGTEIKGWGKSVWGELEPEEMAP